MGYRQNVKTYNLSDIHSDREASVIVPRYGREVMLPERNLPCLFCTLFCVFKCATGHSEICRACDSAHTAEAPDLRNAAVAEVAEKVGFRGGRLQEDSGNLWRRCCVPLISRCGDLYAELDPVAAHTGHNGGVRHLFCLLHNSLHSGHHNVQEEAVV